MASKFFKLGQIGKKALDSRIENVYKLDKTGSKDKIIGRLNKALEKRRKNFSYNKQITEEPSSLDLYTDVMSSDFEKKTGPYFKRDKKRLKGKK
jgi:hypothetical protein